MSSYLLDTNVLLAAANPYAPENRVASTAISSLQLSSDDIFMVPQIATEFWSVATRRGPKGLNWPVEFAASVLNQYSHVTFQWLPDPPNLYQEWLRLCSVQKISGPSCYDARIVALMRIYQIGSILTYNTRHFVDFDGVQAINPVSVRTL